MSDALKKQAREGAEALEAVATLTWAVPLVFALTYAVAWFFSLKNLLLITGHISAIFCATLLAEAAARMGDRQRLAGAAQLTQSLALICILALLYAFYPMIRMFLDSDEPFLAVIESKHPAGRLAVVMTLAYGLGAMALTAFARLLSQAAAEFDQKLSRLPILIVGVFLLAGLASTLHAAFAAKEELRGLRHILFAGMMGLGLLVYLQLYPAIHRVAQCLRREAAQEA